MESENKQTKNKGKKKNSQIEHISRYQRWALGEMDDFGQKEQTLRRKI